MSELYKKLVDLYAGRELPVELNDQMELAAHTDTNLGWEMKTLRNTVDALKADTEPMFTEETYQRILTQIYSRAGSSPVIREDNRLQFQLPIPN